MLVLDTDHISELDRYNAAGASLDRRLDTSGEEVATTIISAEEQLRGWLAQIRAEQDPHRIIPHYRLLYRRIEYFADGVVLPWDTASADVYNRLRAQRIRIGTLDLRIASIVLVQNAMLLSRNLSDFKKVPGLRVENWLE